MRNVFWILQNPFSRKIPEQVLRNKVFRRRQLSIKCVARVRDKYKFQQRYLKKISKKVLIILLMNNVFWNTKKFPNLNKSQRKIQSSSLYFLVMLFETTEKYRCMGVRRLRTFICLRKSHIPKPC